MACQSPKNNNLIIATAANLQHAMLAITEAFTEQTGIKCEVIIGSSGKLTAQIVEGAPFDIFTSADMKYPRVLYKQGLAISTPKIYAFGQLILLTAMRDIQPDIHRLTGEDIHHIVLANPKIAPYGMAAMQVLDHYQLTDKIEDKLVYGESISQTNQFILSGAAEIGITCKSTVFSPVFLDKGRWQAIDSSFYSPLAQGVVILNKKQNSQLFYDFLFSEKSRLILNKFGYFVPELTDAQ